jgi:hypothetical protein
LVIDKIHRWLGGIGGEDNGGFGQNRTATQCPNKQNCADCANHHALLGDFLVFKKGKTQFSYDPVPWLARERVLQGECF